MMQGTQVIFKIPSGILEALLSMSPLIIKKWGKYHVRSRSKYKFNDVFIILVVRSEEAEMHNL